MSAARGAAFLREVLRRWQAGQKNPQIMAELGVGAGAMEAAMRFWFGEAEDDAGKGPRPHKKRPPTAPDSLS